MADRKDILSNNNEQLSDEDVLKYLNTNTSEKEKYAIEKRLADTSFESDAVDGLQHIKNPELLKNHVKPVKSKTPELFTYQKAEKTKKRYKGL